MVDGPRRGRGGSKPNAGASAPASRRKGTAARDSAPERRSDVAGRPGADVPADRRRKTAAGTPGQPAPADRGGRTRPGRLSGQGGARPAPQARPARAPADGEAGERLHKALARAGHGSLRELESMIGAGRVEINGAPAAPGTRVFPGDRVRLDGRPVRLDLRETLPQILIYHKPEGEIVSRDDPQGRTSVFDRLPRLRGARWVSIGRLDLNTSGLLIFTTSGALANRLMHPRFEVEREYAVRVLGELTDETMRTLTRGVELDDGPARFEFIQDEGGEGSNHWYRVMIREGRNREVRRLFDAVGHTVSRLMRVRFGPVNMPPRLKRGMMLELDDKQVRLVLKWAGMPAAHAARQVPRSHRGH